MSPESNNNKSAGMRPGGVAAAGPSAAISYPKAKEPMGLNRLFSLSYPVKSGIARVALLALAVGFEYLSRNCDKLKKEISTWEEGRVFALSVLSKGPSVVLRKENGAIRYIGGNLKDSEIVFYFKNIDSALMLFAGLIGAHTASAQHRTIVHGDIGIAMEVLRAMNIAQSYLYPGIVLKKTFKRAPKLSFSEQILKLKLMLALLPGIVAAYKK
ncbi:MAG TPA: hypothetical protein PLK80_04555 [bacterium]|nr:MAG: hypothetical protein BWY28_01386 [bacterium ADurb.Bin236]HOY64472.1 hypothetical protein [bacterium]HPI75982.1 hypothetical protein [bacterium]HPN93328.1 hypothetical protein [bacterium]